MKENSDPFHVCTPLLLALAVAALLFCLFGCVAHPRGELLSPRAFAYLHDVSLTIESEDGWGSGVVLASKGRVFVLTCAHVVEDNCTNMVQIPMLQLFPNADELPHIHRDGAEEHGFSPVVLHDILFDGQRVRSYGKTTAQVIAYDAETDLALLILSPHIPVPKNVGHLSKRVPGVGAWLWHVGSFMGGDIARESIVSGVFNFEGRLRDDGQVYDQTSVSAVRGSSGGGVFTCDGECIGIVARAGVGYSNLIVPARVITPWLHAHAPKYF